ncbi:hypothetical protein HY643_01325 [Candidatus Woesearchaeota archaeon]|nr:hypothetical protein [Candidatus Woesearchaeota archaeon]
MKKFLTILIIIGVLAISSFASAQDLTEPKIERWTFERYSDPTTGQLFVLTDENAVCKYATIDKDYDAMDNFDATGSTKHYQNIPISESENIYYVRCKDNEGNVNKESTILKFTAEQLKAINCPVLRDPYCPLGKLMSWGKDDAGCDLPKTCCGNKECNTKETEENCPIDCTKCANENDVLNRDATVGFAKKECCSAYLEVAVTPAYSVCVKCGNGECDYPESYETCAEDCSKQCPKLGVIECAKGVLISSGKDKEGCSLPPSCCGNGECDTKENFNSCPKDCKEGNVRLTKVWTDSKTYRSGEKIKVYATVMESDGTTVTPSEGAKVSFDIVAVNGLAIPGFGSQLMTFSSTERYYTGTSYVPKRNPVKVTVTVYYGKDTIRKHTEVIRVTDIPEEEKAKEEKETEKEKRECEKKDGYCTEISECKEGYALSERLGCEDKDNCCLPKETEEEREPSTPTGACEGCKKEDSCLPYGTRVVEESIPTYCGLTKTLTPQVEEGSICQNNYECKTNECSNGTCISTYGLLAKIMQWLKSIFG